jgi:hypothetical protein
VLRYDGAAFEAEWDLRCPCPPPGPRLRGLCTDVSEPTTFSAPSLLGDDALGMVFLSEEIISFKRSSASLR